MFKILTFFSSSITLFITTFFVFGTDQVTVDVTHPSVIKPGQEFIIELTIDKGNLDGFARLQQYIPDGFNVSPAATAGAQFTFDNHVAKFIWTALPVERTFKISYMVIAEGGIDGIKSIDGIFSFIRDEKTEQYSIEKINLQISELDATPSIAEHSTKDEINLAIQREIVQIIPEQNEYKVILTIQRNPGETAATFYDQLPNGYTAEAINIASSKFAFENGVVKFYWEQLPADSIIHISYFASCKKKILHKPSITGMMVYGEPLTNNPMMVINNGAIKTIPEAESVSKILSNEVSRIGSVSDENPAPMVVSPSQGKGIAPTPNTATFSPSSTSGVVEYKIQISATNKSSIKDGVYFLKKYGLNNEVFLTDHEGWKKYLIGSFQNYGEAKLLKNQTIGKVKDAFIVAYMNGQRIPIQQALKVNNSNLSFINNVNGKIN